VVANAARAASDLPAPDDLQEDGVLAQLLVAGEVPAAVAGNAEQNVDVAGVGASCCDLHAGEHDAVEWHGEPLRRCVGAAQPSAEVSRGARHPVEVLAVPRGAYVEILGRTLRALPLRGQSTDRDERDSMALECADQRVGIERRRIGVTHALGLLGSYGGRPYRARCSSTKAISSSGVARLRGPVCPIGTGVSSARRGAQLALTQSPHSFSEANLDFTRRDERSIWTFAIHPRYHRPRGVEGPQDPRAPETRGRKARGASRSDANGTAVF
jgi:hypothetical protein